MFDQALLEEARLVLDLCRRADVRLATAESCTGGLMAAQESDGFVVVWA